MTITLGPFAGLPPGPNRLSGQHWSKVYKAKQEWQQLVAFTAKSYMQSHGLKGLMDQAKVHYHVSVGDNRVHDPDNIIASLKGAHDGLKGLVIVDDSIDHVELSYSFDRAKPRGFTITLTEI